MLTITICDDEAKQREFLEMLVQAWADAAKLEVIIQKFATAQAFLDSYWDNPDTQILLLDIEMPGLSGVDLAREIRSENKEIQIVFVSGYSEYIADGYDVEALNFLIKPVKEEKLYQVLDKAREKLASNERALIFELPGESLRVPLYEICALEVYRNYVTIRTTKDAFEVKTPLSKLAADLDERFFRVGRSAIVNLKFIARVTRLEIVLTDGHVIQLPRGYYDKIHQAMIRYL